MRLGVAMIGATGAALGIRLLEALGQLGIESHLVLSEWARATIKIETDFSVSEVRVVEEDVDIHDPAALDWAMSYRVNAGRGDIAFFGPGLGSSLDPSTSPERNDTNKYGTGEWTWVLIDATRSWDIDPRPTWGGRRFPPTDRLAADLEARIAARREEYGIGIPYPDDDGRERLTLARLSKRMPQV